MPTSTAPDATRGADARFRARVDPYDALLLLSFGGPNTPEDVVPFLRNVTLGKDIPDERLRIVGQHYYDVGGLSPINGQNLALKSALECELAARGIALPIVWGNRNWAPYLPEALDELERLGVRRAAVLVTSAYSSYSGCRQYREDLDRALSDRDGHGAGQRGAVQLDKLRSYFNHPGFVQANAESVASAWTSLTHRIDAQRARIVFVTHSIPLAMEAASGLRRAPYTAQHRDLATQIVAHVQATAGRTVDWDLVFCSRSGPPRQPWLEPDVNDHLAALSASGVEGVVLAPIGFISDHMEVVYDLDTQAAETAANLGMATVRAATAGTHPAFVAGLVDLVIESAAQTRGEAIDPAVTGRLAAFDSPCLTDCCRVRPPDAGTARA